MTRLGNVRDFELLKFLGVDESMMDSLWDIFDPEEDG